MGDYQNPIQFLPPKPNSFYVTHYFKRYYALT